MFTTQKDIPPSMKLLTQSMPTYSGTGRTSRYLQERNLREAAKNNKKITSFFQLKPSIPNHHHVQPIHGSPTPTPSPSISVVVPNAPITICDTVLSNNEPEPSKPADLPILPDDSDDESNKSANRCPQPDLLDPEQPIHNEIDETNFPLSSFLDMTGDDEVTESNTEPVLETVNKLLEQAKKI